ncbi:MAG: FkbM family methyltransferase [Bacteroidia bacterium]|nr:FkbM family methyltransferase [Bacteroidia bacterium]
MGNSIKNPNKLFNTFRSLFIVFGVDRILRLIIRNQSSTSLVGKLAPNNYQYKHNTVRKFKFNKVWIEADISDYVAHYLYFGFKDIAHQKLLNLAIKDAVVLDIGTNIGSTLLQFANKVGENGRVYGFEPDKINYQVCLKNISLNKFKNIDVSNIGLGETNDTFILAVDTPTNRGGNRIVIKKPLNKESIKIDVQKLDDWILSKNIDRINLIKIDVEGFDLKVLKGGVETIKKFKPILFIELDDNNLKTVDDSAKNLVEFMENLNYNIINAENNQPVFSNQLFTDCHFDIICTPK